MVIPDSSDLILPAVGMAVQRLVLDTTKSDGAGLVNLIASAPMGSTNSASQGRFLDAHA